MAKIDADIVQGISPASSLILYVQGPGLEPSADHEKSIFGRRCGILFYANDDGVEYARSISTIELLRLYGFITQHREINPEILFSMNSTLDALLPHSLPYEFLRSIMDTSTLRSNMLNDFISSCKGKIITAQCFHIEHQNSNNTLDWGKSYKDDNGNFRIISHLQKHKADDWSLAVFKDINIKYHIILKRRQLQMLNNRLVLYKPVMMNSKYLELIVVPQSLRKRLFKQYHSGPMGGYMGEYKTFTI